MCARMCRRNALSRTSKDFRSQSSNRRRISHSPVSVNTTFELGQRNTEKLWKEFNTHIRKSVSIGSRERKLAN